MKDTPSPTDSAADLFKRAFPKAHLGAYYRDLLTRHVTDLDLFAQVLADERNDLSEGARRRVRVPWLIEQYQRMERSIREIETPPDCLTTHRNTTIDPGEQMNHAQLKDLLSGIDWHKGNHT